MTHDHLTDAGTELGRLAARTPPGMAYFVETGPAGATCAGCKFFLGEIKRSGVGKGDLQPGRCSEFIRMMRSKGYASAPVYDLPTDTAARRHWEVKPAPKERTQRQPSPQSSGSP